MATGPGRVFAMKKKFMMLLVAAVVSVCFGACSSQKGIELVDAQAALSQETVKESQDSASSEMTSRSIVEKIPSGNSLETLEESQPSEGKDSQSTNPTQKEPGSETAPSGKIYVYVCGAVNHPGVYQLGENARVYEAVAEAGGFSTDADEEYVNQAQLLADGVKLLVPTKDEVLALSQGSGKTVADVGQGAGSKSYGITGSLNAGSVDGTTTVAGISGGEDTTNQEALQSVPSGVSANGLVNINTASAQELQSISGIGATRAQAIIGYREANGGFTCIEDVKKVSGIKDAVFNRIKDHITVN